MVNTRTQDVTAMFHTFDSLKTIESRREVLHTFASKLTRDEVRELGTWAVSRDFRHDIIGHLPLELVDHVFQNLDLRVVFGCRRVSKRWANILTSSTLILPRLQSWYGKDDPRLLEKDLSSPSLANASMLAEQVDAFCSGKPFSSMVFAVDLNWKYEYNRSVIHSYVEHRYGRIAWCDAAGHKISLYDVRSQRTFSWLQDPTDQIWRITLSEAWLVTCNSSGTVRVYDYLTWKEYAFRLPAADPWQVTTRGSTVAILHKRKGQGYPITVWDCVVQNTQQLSISLDGRLSEVLYDCQLILGPNEDSIILSEIIYHKTSSDGCPPWFSFTKISMDGRVLATEQFSNPVRDVSVPIDYLRIPPYICNPCGEYGVFVGHSRVGKKLVLISYNIDRNCFNTRVINYHKSFGCSDSVNVRVWNNVVYGKLLEDTHAFMVNDPESKDREDWVKVEASPVDYDEASSPLPMARFSDFKGTSLPTGSCTMIALRGRKNFVVHCFEKGTTQLNKSLPTCGSSKQQEPL